MSSSTENSENTKKPIVSKRPYLKGVIIATTILIILSAIILVTLLLLNNTKICDNPICLKEVAKIKSQFDPKISPCEDFYHFSCGNYIKEVDNNEITEQPDLIKKQAQDEILQLYTDPVLQDDHYSIKLSKRLYKACMNVSAIENDNLETINRVLKIVGGGWPLLEGSKWNESEFDWLSATYKLRKMGYYYPIFLDLDVRDDPRNSTRSILQVRIPFDLDEAADSLSHKKAVIRKVALAFGMEINRASKEMKKLYEFAKKLSDQMLDHRGLSIYPILTVEELQKAMGYINWLEFFNNITGPKTQVSKKDSVIVVEAATLRQRFELLSRTPKRIQANYMMWKLIQQTLPYLTTVMQDLLSEGEAKEPRSIFCLKEIQKKFPVSPMDIIYARKYLPIDKKNNIEKIVALMKKVFLTLLDDVTWLSKQDKSNIKDKAEELIVIIGEPGNYFDNKILDDLILDMEEIDSENFLNLISLADRNYRSIKFSKINQMNERTNWMTRDIYPLTYYLYYYPEHNVLRLPAAHLKNDAFDQTRPNYLNFGKLGKDLGKEFASLLKVSSSYFDRYGNKVFGWSQETTEKYGTLSSCLIKNMGDFKKVTFDFMLIEMQTNIVGVKLAYETYQAWIKTEGDEYALIDLEFSPNQLFWMSTVTCYPNNTEAHHLSYLPDTRDLPKTLVYATMRNNPQFSEDFNCPVGSPMNPSEKCRTL